MKKFSAVFSENFVSMRSQFKNYNLKNLIIDLFFGCRKFLITEIPFPNLIFHNLITGKTK